MKKIVLTLSLIMTSLQVNAIDFNDLVNKAKSKINKVLNKEEKKEKVSSITLPKIPKITKDAKSTDVYTKKGKIHEQGSAFNKLSLEEKRKYRIAFIDELYEVTKGGKVSDSDLKSKLNMLEQGGTREGIYRLLVLDTSYRRLEASELVSSDKLVTFTVNYGEKYLGRVFDPELVGKLNPWGVKKIIVEKSLEVIDALAHKEDDLYRWYAVLSAELANKNSALWKNKTRKRYSAEYHYRWAKKVPFQLIKSEVIIKLHKLMNQLNQS